VAEVLFLTGIDRTDHKVSIICSHMHGYNK